MTNSREQFDVVVVGARCAGSAAAITFANGGRKVLAIDRSAFPSDTLSTHANFPSSVAEMQRLGALPRIRKAGAPECREAYLSADGIALVTPWDPVDGIDYGLCNPREAFDEALVETAREAGAEVREKTSLVDVLWRAGRASGVRVKGPEGEYEVDCKLVVGADGRRSMTAYRVGADVPYRGSKNGRGLAFWYCDDPMVGTEWRNRLCQFRAGVTHTLLFPCPDDRMLVLFMGPAEEIPDFRRDPMGMWDRMMAANPVTAERCAGAKNHSKLRSTGSTSAFFRRSSGPGWALAGDSGHFKDPIIGQGMRDAMRFGRILAERAGPVIDDPARLDGELLATERQRDEECMASYHWGNRESRIFAPSDLVKTTLETWSRKGEPGVAQMFDRTKPPHHVLNPIVGVKMATRAALKRGTDHKALLAEIREEARIDLDIWREEIRKPFRPTRVWASERPGFDWPSAAPAQPKEAAVAPDSDTLERSLEAVGP
jgi:flavin-dependent dehydrogenase